MDDEKEIISVSEYIDIFKNQEHQHVSLWLFRGHNYYNDELIPSLFRIDRKKAWANWNKIEDYVHNISGKQLSWDVCPQCQKTPNFLSLSYFNELMGPTILLFAPEEDLSKYNEKISRILDLDNNFPHFFVVSGSIGFLAI